MLKKIVLLLMFFILAAGRGMSAEVTEALYTKNNSSDQETTKVITFSGAPSLDRIEINHNQLDDVKGNGKKFKGTATLFLNDDNNTQILLTVKIKVKNNDTSKYRLKTNKGVTPKFKMKMKTRGTPEQIQKYKIKFDSNKINPSEVTISTSGSESGSQELIGTSWRLFGGYLSLNNQLITHIVENAGGGAGTPLAPFDGFVSITSLIFRFPDSENYSLRYKLLINALSVLRTDFVINGKGDWQVVNGNEITFFPDEYRTEGLAYLFGKQISPLVQENPPPYSCKYAISQDGQYFGLECDKCPEQIELYSTFQDCAEADGPAFIFEKLVE